MRGFTLSEILITLGIIGVISAITLPILISNHNERVTVTKVKKAHAFLNQVFKFAHEEYGPPSQWGITGRDASDNSENGNNEYNASNAIMIRDKLFFNSNISAKCNNAKNQQKCGFANKYFDYLGILDSATSNNTAQTASLKLNDGTSFMVIANPQRDNRGSGELESTYGIIYIDTNGIKAPNSFGKDVFTFYLTGYGVTPIGTQNETKWTISTCRLNGLSCTAWIVNKGNMKYLKNNISW